MNDNLFSGVERPFVVSCSSPKGGAGTTLLAANSAIQFAKKGNNVLLVDLGLARASCHLALGMPLPEKNISCLASSRGSDLKNCVSPTPVSNLSLIAGLPESSDVANIPYLVKQKLITEARNLPYDYIIFDAGSGTGSDSLDFALAADTSIFVVSPGPFNLEPFYRYVRALLHRLLVVSLNKKRYQALSGKIDFLSPLPSLFQLDETGEQDLQEVEKVLAARRFGFVFTRVSEKELRFGPQVESMVRKFFSLSVEFMGGLDWDATAENAVSSLEAISKNHPICPYSLSVEKLVNKITKQLKDPAEPPRPREMAYRAGLTAYEVLEILPNALAKDIQAAYQKKLEIYLDNSFVPIGLLSKEEKERERDLLEQSYKLLINSQSRQKYDEEMINKGVLTEEERISDYKEVQQELLWQPPETPDANGENGSRDENGDAVGEVAYYDGLNLRKIRQALKISVEEIVAETNIRSWYIDSIEEERFDALPARIYVKGFLKQLAQYLRLSQEKVLRDYLEKYDTWAAKKAD